jgi:hypothetical protein
MLLNDQNLLRRISKMFKKVILPLVGIGIIGITGFLPISVKANQHNHTISQTEGEEQERDIEYLTILGLMKGHLIVAKELLALGQPEKAEPHIGHPVEELYEVLKPHLEERTIPEFKSSLQKLHQLVKYKPNDPNLNTYYSEVIKGIDTAIKSVSSTKSQSPDFIMALIRELLVVADEEYSAAIANGKIVEEIEYQDAMGFVLYAEMLYKTIEDQVSPQLGETLAELKKAWPTVLPPTQVVKTPEEVSELISKL